MDDQSSDRIIREKEPRMIVPYSSMHIWRLEKAGRFPQRIRLGPNRIGWSLREVSEWLAARKAERPNPKATSLSTSSLSRT